MAAAVLGDIFRACEVLPVASRLRIAELLRVTGLPTAAHPEEFRALPLPDAADALEVLRAAIVSGLGHANIEALAEARLVDVIPALGDAPGGPKASRSIRVTNALDANGPPTWARLGPSTLGEITAMPGVGKRSLAALLELAVGVAIGRCPIKAASVPGDNLDAVLVRALEEAGDTRSRLIFEQLVLPIEETVSAAWVAACLEIGHQRVRQLREQSVERVRYAALAQNGEQPAVVHPVVAQLADRLGVVAPRAELDQVLSEIGLPPLPDTRSQLMVWLAGPYRALGDAQPGWVARDPAMVISDTARVLCEDGGVRLGDHVRDDLASIGVSADHVDAWLAAQSVRFVDDVVVLTAGSPLAVAERLLAAAGSPLSTDELCAPDQTAGPLSVQALSRDRRFARVGPDEWALSEWGAVAADEGHEAGTLSLRIEVDAGVLAGAGGTLPLALARSLRLTDATRRTFASRYGPLHLTFDGTTANRGSLRPIALAIGAMAGEVLTIGFDPVGDSLIVELTASGRPVGSLF